MCGPPGFSQLLNASRLTSHLHHSRNHSRPVFFLLDQSKRPYLGGSLLRDFELCVVLLDEA